MATLSPLPDNTAVNVQVYARNGAQLVSASAGVATATTLSVSSLAHATLPLTVTTSTITFTFTGAAYAVRYWDDTIPVPGFVITGLGGVTSHQATIALPLTTTPAPKWPLLTAPEERCI